MQDLITWAGDLDTLDKLASVGAFLLAVILAVIALRGSRTRPEIPERAALADLPPGIIGVPPGREVVGRETEVAAVRMALRAGGHAGVVLKGEGGRGKSTLARRYAEVHGGDYHGGLWVHAGTRQAAIDGLMTLCAPLALQVPDTAREQHAQAVLRKVEAGGKKWLFVYDNVEGFGDIKGLIPTGAHLIVTTRQGEGWKGWEVMATDVLDFSREDAPAVVLLMQEAGRWDHAAEARALASDLGGLPLALVVAGALIEATGEGFAAYAGRLGEVMERAPANEDYPTSVRGAVQLSYDKLEPDARTVADLCAWWAAEGLAPALLTEAPQGDWWEARKAEIPEPVQALAAGAGRVRAAFGALAGRSLITREGDAWTMHRMTARALRALQAARADAAPAEAAAALLDSVYPGGARGVSFSENWPLCAQLTPHVRALWATGAAPRGNTMETLLNQSSVYLDAIADYPGAAEMDRVAWKLKTARLPEADREVAVAEANLGLALRRLGDLAGAEAHLARAVALNEAHRPGSADLADSYDLHGGVLLDQARAGAAALLPQAAWRYQQALALRRRVLGRGSDPVAEALNNLGAVRDAQGRAAAAARLYGASLRIRRAVLPPGDARLGWGLLNTGAMSLKSGAAGRAEPPLREALDLWQAVHAAQPQHHPDTRLAADWLISCLLVRARAGEDSGQRETEARRLCEHYGFDFAERQAMARRFAYTPGA